MSNTTDQVITAEQLADYVGYLPLAPDFVAEIVSPSDRSSQVEAKARDWLDAGVQVVLVVDPQTSMWPSCLRNAGVPPQ